MRASLPCTPLTPLFLSHPARTIGSPLLISGLTSGDAFYLSPVPNMTAAAITPVSSTIPKAAAVAGSKETTVMTVWPSNGKYLVGRLLGQGYGITFPNVYIFRLGHLVALASIPIALVLFFMRIAPFIGIRYRLTSKRVTIERGLSSKVESSVNLDRFDAIDIVVQPGQEWYSAGDLVFKLGNVETFRLEGVSRPDTFRQTCLKAQISHVGVIKAMKK